ncbi:hypothetical protein CQ050_26925 [Achromobacter sp. MYb9]|uniref:hypothetical protein n=1 Tax=Achromobacter sp. MYb9 TaxID=1827284 RepID=UPI000CFDD7FB|nr:hypothetical protein [Achromobacter sp. MYb9]PQZ60005.1 hypothetical protein CQ050_26925 [Achromobacter sp. MYb9]
MSELQFFDRVLARLRAVPYTELQTVADATHVSLSNLRKIRYGEVKNPGVQTVQALDDYFVRIDGTGDQHFQTSDSSQSSDLPAKKV